MPDKIFRFQDAFIGTVGYAVHNAVLQSYFSRHPENVTLDSPAGIFETWRVMHKVLRDEYHLNPRKDSEDAYETTRMTAVVASPRGIFGITPSRDVEAFPRFWAIGSGADFALGAMFVMYQRSDDVEEIARAGVEAGAEFDDGSDVPVIAAPASSCVPARCRRPSSWFSGGLRLGRLAVQVASAAQGHAAASTSGASADVDGQRIAGLLQRVELRLQQRCRHVAVLALLQARHDQLEAALQVHPAHVREPLREAVAVDLLEGGAADHGAARLSRPRHAAAR